MAVLKGHTEMVVSVAFSPDGKRHRLNNGDLVTVTFTAEGAATRVRIEQTGWDALGAAGPVRRERTQAGWAATTVGYRDLLANEHPSARSPAASPAHDVITAIEEAP